MDKVVMLDEKDFPEWYDEKAAHNHYNALPKNWKEISQEAFIRSMEQHGFSHIEHRQAPLKVPRGTPRYLAMHENITLYYQGGPEGIATVPVHQDCSYSHYRYFSFTDCVHKWEDVDRERMEKLAKKFPHLAGKGTWGRCCHNSVCIKCGDYRFVDSSD